VINIATVRDIAKLANVSASTVSRVLNLDQTINVSIDTRKRIFEAAEQLSYQKPERETSSLTQYALIHWYDEVDELNDPFFLSIRLGIERECNLNNISLEKYFNSGCGHIYDIHTKYQGIIVLGKFSHEYINYFEEHTKNLILVHDFSKDFKFESVIVNFEELTKDVLDTMIKCGHEKIGFIGGREKVIGSTKTLIDERETAFIDYMTKKGFFHERYIKIGNFNYSDGYTMMKSLIDDLKGDLPTSIFIASDSLAIGAMRALKDCNINVPDTVSIIACNDIPAAKYTTPSLSTVRISTDFMGMLSAQLLINQNQRKEKLRYIIPHEIILRDTFKKRTEDLHAR